jgi:hypothetical protein
MRTSFYMSPPPSGFYAVPNGQNIDKELQPYLNDFSKEWVLLIGNYQYSFKTKERIHIPVRNAAGGVAGDYTLISLKRGCDTSPANIGSKTATSADNIEVMPGPQTPHTIGKFNPTGASMVAGKGESGAIIYGPYIKLRPGCYAATFHVTAESAVLGTEVGTLDVSEYMPPNVDERVVYIPLQSATGEQSVKLTFKVDNPAYVYQFRVWTNGVANQVSIRSINIERI